MPPLPSPSEIAHLKSIALGGSDLDLPAADRRSRQRTVPGRVLAPDQVVRVGGIELVVLGAGRGRSVFLAAYLEPALNIACLGSFFEHEIDRG